MDLCGRPACFLLVMDLWFIICKRCGNDRKNEGQKVKHQMKIQNRVSVFVTHILLLLEYSEGPVRRNCSTYAQLFGLSQLT